MDNGGRDPAGHAAATLLTHAFRLAERVLGLMGGAGEVVAGAANGQVVPPGGMERYSQKARPGTAMVVTRWLWAPTANSRRPPPPFGTRATQMRNTSAVLLSTFTFGNACFTARRRSPTSTPRA